jgi:hypothetical protein
MYRATSSDVNLVDDPDELTPKAELIVEGQIVGFSTGRHWQFGGEGTDPVTSTIMKVIVSKKFKGAPGYVNSTVYVEHFLAFDVDLNELNSSLVGYQCGLFLIEAAGAGTAGLLDPTGGRPLGQKLWVAGGQTFVVQDKSKTQVVCVSSIRRIKVRVAE